MPCAGCGGRYRHIIENLQLLIKGDRPMEYLRARLKVSLGIDGG